MMTKTTKNERTNLKFRTRHIMFLMFVFIAHRHSRRRRRRCRHRCHFYEMKTEAGENYMLRDMKIISALLYSHDMHTG